MSAVWATDANTIYVTNGDRILSFDQNGFKSVVYTDSDSSTILRNMWGSGPSDFWAVGGKGFFGDGVFVHFDGTQFQSYGSVARPATVWGTSATDVYFSGDAVFHWDGTQFDEISLLAQDRMTALWGDSNGYWLFGRRGLIARHP